jgi:hypothetical protein
LAKRCLITSSGISWPPAATLRLTRSIECSGLDKRK